MAPPIRLPSDRSRPSPLRQSWARLKQVRGLGDLAKWSTRSFRLAQLPLRIRPAFLFLLFLTLLVLSLLGFHPSLATHVAPPSVPFFDKVLHFVCFAIATALFYACWVVEEHARRVTLWRYWNELVSLAGFTLIVGIGSEFVQALLPYKHFQLGDVVANVLGSGLAVAVMHHWSREARRAAELRRLYVHLDQMPDDDDDDDDDDEDNSYEGAGAEGTTGGSAGYRYDRSGGRAAGSFEASEAAEQGRLLRQHREMQESHRGSASTPGGGGGKVRFARVDHPLSPAASTPGAGGATMSAAARRKQALDPWSATDDEIFGLGDDDDEEEENNAAPGRASSSRSNRNPEAASRSPA